MTSSRPLLILGADGRVGTALVRACASRGIAAIAAGRAVIDLARPAEAAARVREARPGTVVNAAAFTDVGAAEDPGVSEALFTINRDAPAALAETCAASGIRFAHLSTDYVFDGASRRPYVESDPTAPIQRYGLSKRDGERAVLAAMPEALIVRLATVYGTRAPFRPAFVDAILDQARRQPVVETVETPVASPTYAADAAEAILDLLAAGATGVVHGVNDGACSRLELARAVVELAGLGAEVEVRRRAEPVAGPKRPAYAVLDTARLESILGRRLRPWREALRAYLQSVLGGARG